jgi:hypothetical protein
MVRDHHLVVNSRQKLKIQSINIADVTSSLGKVLARFCADAGPKPDVPAIRWSVTSGLGGPSPRIRGSLDGRRDPSTRPKRR